jgi:signal transduction histidine kinase
VELTVFDKLNKEIFIVISHDLKEPLISIRFFLDEIKNKKASDTERAIADLEDHVKITSTILNDLLTWSAVELRVSQSEEEKVRFEEIITASTEHFKQIIELFRITSLRDISFR